ncbi:hypothetical protein L198_08043 [Cryptococcus wingfieldii CBS 7118]|uniref:Uncharacterized protein n=1 Tax=Cryptococcus wingfieldii CBS 7118 TaxID=1295528 RepID=A0A1E3HLT4_9TREE|nr:hypothetical protein L198_08043 [Cryptococcus wingfieldii CBS 7118]ODN77308.1 hypothetical protein L198_08043 [Cryptococcus wingfieldii CBS 7118]
MSSPQSNNTRSELLATTILVEGCFPTLIATGASDDGHHKHVSYPVIDARAFVKSFQSDGHGREVSVPVPIEVEEAAKEYMDMVGRVCERLQSEPPLPQWDGTITAFRQYTNRAHTRRQNQLSEVVPHVYASRDTWPFTCRVHANVQELLEDGGQLLGPEDQPMEPSHYADRLTRTVKSAKNLDLLSHVSPGTIKIVFTTHLTEPLRLVKKDADSSNNEGEDIRPLHDWGLLYPQESVECQVTDDSPEWIKRNRAAQEAYRQSIIEAIGDSTDPGTSVELTVETTADDFVQDTKRYEQLLFREAAYITANQVSFREGETHRVGAPSIDTDDLEMEDDEGELVDGHLVKAVWLDPSMFAVLTGQQPKGREFYSKKFSEYKTSIEEGLATMRREVEQGRSEVDDFVPSGAREWGTWTQLSDV